jgi:tetratricopeptide (TPR) repeat protein
LLLFVQILLRAPLSAGTAPQGSQDPARSPSASGETQTIAPDSLAPLLAQAQQALDREDYAAAMVLLQTIIAARPGDALPHFQLGYAHSRLQQYAEAAAEYRRALALDPSLGPAHLNLGLVLLDSDAASAADSFHRAATLLPDQARPRYLAGQALERAGKATEAISDYEAAVLLAPQEAPIRSALAWALLRAGRAAEAEAQFRRTILLPGDTTDAGRGLARALLRQNKYAEAAQAFAAYIAGHPGDVATRFEHAVALQGIGRFEEALAELDRVEQSAVPSTDTWELRAGILVQQRKWKEAAALLEKAIAASPGNARLHGALGHAKLESRDFGGAERALRQSLELDPAALGPLRDLAVAYHLSGQCPAALATLDQLAERETPAAVHWFFRALCYDKLRQQSEAVGAYQKFLELDGGRNPDQEFQARQRLRILQRELENRRR